MKEIKRWSAQKGFDFDWEQAPTFLMLIVTEASEAMQAWRDDNKAKFAEELADLVIRAFHMAGQLGIDLEAEVARKMAINWRRPYRHGHKRALRGPRFPRHHVQVAPHASYGRVIAGREF